MGGGTILIFSWVLKQIQVMIDDFERTDAVEVFLRLQIVKLRSDICLRWRSFRKTIADGSSFEIRGSTMMQLISPLSATLDLRLVCFS